MACILTLKQARSQVTRSLVAGGPVALDETTVRDLSSVPDFFVCPEQTTWLSTAVKDVLSCRDGHSEVSWRVKHQSA